MTSSKRDEILDSLFRRLRKLEGHEDSPTDLIYERLRKLERRADTLEKLVYMAAGALALFQFLLRH